MAASVYPVTAVLYILFNLRIRFNEVLDIGLRNEWGGVYFPKDSIDRGELKLRRYIRRRFHEYYSPWQLALLALVTGVTAFMLGAFIVSNILPPTKDFELTHPNTWRILGTAGLSGGYVGSLVLLLKKFRTFDLYPSTYFQAMVGIVAGTIVGSAFGALFPFQNAIVGVLAIGFFSATRVNLLFDLLRAPLAKATGVTPPPEIASDLHQVIENTEAIESLRNISVNSLAELVRAEPIRLYLNLAQQVDVVNGWIDTALLAHHFSTRLDALGAVDVRSLTQLLERLERKEAVTGDAATDQQVEAVACDLLGSRMIERSLSLLSIRHRLRAGRVV